jgi:hypothetical protein
MTALSTLSSALAMHDDTPSDEFEFESEYVKALLKQTRTPSPVVAKATITDYRGKENLDRWRTPVSLGVSSGRSILAQRDANVGFSRSASVMGINGENENKENTSAVKLSSSYVM